MSFLEPILALLRNPDASANAAWAAAKREPQLYELGKSYRTKFVDCPAAADLAALEAEIHHREHQLGFAPISAAAVLAAGSTNPVSAWKNHLLARLLEEPDPQAAPEAVVVAGQPGAGKGTLTEELCQQFARRGGCVVIDRNELVRLHPSFAPAVERNPESAEDAVRDELVHVTNHLLNDAVAARLHVILDDSLAEPSESLARLERLTRGGYRTTVLALHVLPRFSWENVQERYERLCRHDCPGRWVSQDAHDRACAGLVDVLSSVEEHGLADGWHVVTIFGECLASQGRRLGGSPGTIRRLYDGFGPLATPTKAVAATAPPPPAAHPPAAKPAASNPVSKAPPAIAAASDSSNGAANLPPKEVESGRPRGVRIIRPGGSSAGATTSPAAARQDDPARTLGNMASDVGSKSSSPAEAAETDPEIVKRREEQRRKLMEKGGRKSNDNRD